jgi:hypothetical protein
MNTPSMALAPGPQRKTSLIGFLGMEPLRAAFEFAGFHLMDRSTLPAGDGHPVVFFPGLATDGRALAPLRNCCRDLGYTVHDWQLGFNTGPHGDFDDYLRDLIEHVHQLSLFSARRVSLVGWSMGGIYAREIAKALPKAVRQVVTLGTPLAPQGNENLIQRWQSFLQDRATPVTDTLLARLRINPPVPTTAIYSKSDGVVAWETCLVNPASQAENIEVESSHLGLTWNPQALQIVADRLNQAPGRWQRHAQAH